MSVSKKVLDEVALSEKEYELIVQRLGREPNEVELGMFGSLWSEHCGYKHSKPLLKLLPSQSRCVLVGPGEENAGVVDIGDGQVVVMKIESHNHHSAIDPYQGAATAVGGVIRNIFTMGARPIAWLNSLRFGPLTESTNYYVFNGVVGGIADYGNRLGIPCVGGEIFFTDRYTGNPLVNGLCLGICEKSKLIKAVASGEGNILMVVGADTGRDGIHCTSGLASRTLKDEPKKKSMLPTGNPALEKQLIEACLELAQTDWIVGMQDLGAAGLTSSTVETAARGGAGVEIDVLRVRRCEEDMTPYEVMLSESQERMLVIVKKGYEKNVKALLDRWGIYSDIIGRVTDSGVAVIKEGEKVVAEIPVNLLVSPPLYRQRSRRPAWLQELQSFNTNFIPAIKARRCNAVLLLLLASPNVASKQYIYSHFAPDLSRDQAMTSDKIEIVVPLGGDAGVLHIKGTKKGIALTVDGNGRYCYVNPFVGGVIAVAEAARNLVCSGAEPIALTDCLNFGNPEKADIYYQMKECIKGMARACRELRVPVISGNVSLYNESIGQAIYPTPIVGMVGMVEDINRHCTISFKREGDLVFLLGESPPLTGSSQPRFHRGQNGLGASEYLELVHNMVRGNPSIDLDMEKRVQRCCLWAAKQGLLKSAHDCSEGGLLVAIAESCICGDIGFMGVNWNVEGRLDSAFFGEYQSRIVVSISSDSAVKLSKISRKWQIPLTLLGRVGGKRLVVEGYINLSLAKMKRAWRDSLKTKIQARNQKG